MAHHQATYTFKDAEGNGLTLNFQGSGGGIRLGGASNAYCTEESEVILIGTQEMPFVGTLRIKTDEGEILPFELISQQVDLTVAAPRTAPRTAPCTAPCTAPHDTAGMQTIIDLVESSDSSSDDNNGNNGNPDAPPTARTTTLIFSDASSDDDNGKKGDDDDDSNAKKKKDEEEKKDKGESTSDRSVSKNNQPQEIPKQVKAEVLVTEDSKGEKKVIRRSRRGAK
jgi:hypothetical protein